MRVPADLGVKVGVQVDEARRHREAVSIDLPLALGVDLADLDDLVTVDGDIGAEWLGSCSVDDRTAPDNEVMAHGVPPSPSDC